MHPASRRLAGILLIVFPAVIYGGVSLGLILEQSPGYVDNPVRQDLWRAGHAHAGVYLVLALVILRYVDEARLSAGLKSAVRHADPIAAILIPAAFFLSIASPAAREPNALVYLAYAGAVVLGAGLVVLSIGLLRES